MIDNEDKIFFGVFIFLITTAVIVGVYAVYNSIKTEQKINELLQYDCKELINELKKDNKLTIDNALQKQWYIKECWK